MKASKFSWLVAGGTVPIWTYFQFATEAPPAILDQVLLAMFGVAFAESAIARGKSPDPPTEDGEVPQTYVDDAKGTFYCQTGDHIVDHAVWLESITMGCRPCLEKLGLAISTEDWLPRLWAVGPEGTKLAKPIKRPEPKRQWFENPTPPKGGAGVSPATKVPFGLTRPRTAKAYVAQHQDWTCRQCHRSYDTMDGFYNNSLGFICKKCNGTVKMDSSQSTTAQREARAAADRQRKMIERQHEQIDNMRKRRAEEVAKNKLRAAMSDDFTRYGAPTLPRNPFSAGGGENISRSGTGTTVRLARIEAGQRVAVSGTGSSIIVDGDVGAGAIVSANGTGTKIMIHGHVGRDAVVHAEGTGSRITYKTRDQRSQVQAHGTGASVEGKVLADDLSAEQRKARAEMALKYDLPYDHDWLDAKIKMAQSVDHLQAKLYVCTCVRCGKRDTDNPVLGGSAALDAQYKCTDCIKAVSAQQSHIPDHRLAQLVRVKGLRTVSTMDHLGDHRVHPGYTYVSKSDQLFKGTREAWTQVPMPSAVADPPEIKTPAHKHVMVQVWGESGEFCNQCGYRA